MHKTDRKKAKKGGGGGEHFMTRTSWRRKLVGECMLDAAGEEKLRSQKSDSDRDHVN